VKVGDLVEYDHPIKLFYGIIMSIGSSVNVKMRGYTEYSVTRAQIWVINQIPESERIIKVDIRDPRLKKVSRETAILTLGD